MRNMVVVLNEKEACILHAMTALNVTIPNECSAEKPRGYNFSNEEYTDFLEDIKIQLSNILTDDIRDQWK